MTNRRGTNSGSTQGRRPPQYRSIDIKREGPDVLNHLEVPCICGEIYRLSVDGPAPTNAACAKCGAPIVFEP